MMHRDDIVVCPDCRQLVKYSYYFGKYTCTCGWNNIFSADQMEDKKRAQINRMIYEHERE
jgi:hypothetical protein